MKETIDIAIAEDHPLLREGLLVHLKKHKNINILFEASDGKELMDKLKITKPDILLLDLQMPIITGAEVLERIKSKNLNIKVIIISAYFDNYNIIEAFRLGVKAFLRKDASAQKVMDAIFSVHEKGIYSDDEVTKILATELQNSNTKKAKKPILSDTEIRVLDLICKGTSRQKAAQKLGVKIETINFHMANMKRKTGVENTPALINYAVSNKLVK
jgi:DNA-binding NarL/FixJ family response regulator